MIPKNVLYFGEIDTIIVLQIAVFAYLSVNEITEEVTLDYITSLLKSVSDTIWGGFMSNAVFCFGVWATFRFGFPQRRLFGAIKDSLGQNGKASGLGALSFLVMNLAATLGVGNIVGVAIAIELGGAGAVFWCCLTGFFAMSISYAECFLSLKFRRKDTDGNNYGGPMCVMEDALRFPKMAVFYASLAAITGLCMGAMVSSNSIASALSPVCIPPWFTGVIAALLTAAVILGGVRSVSNFCLKIVPMMVLLFFIGCLSVLAIYSEYVFAAVRLIFTDAFNFSSVLGGAVGWGTSKAIHFGISRGVFSNEAGMGSSAITAGSLENGDTGKQAMVCATGTFWDTCVLCALTGITFVTAQCAAPNIFVDAHGFDAALAVFSVIPFFGRSGITICLILLGFTSIIGWSFVGERAFNFLFPKLSVDKYRLAWVLAVFIGACVPIDSVWYLTDICTALMMVPNLYAVFKLRNLIGYGKTRETNVNRKFTQQKP